MTSADAMASETPQQADGQHTQRKRDREGGWQQESPHRQTEPLDQHQTRQPYSQPLDAKAAAREMTAMRELWQVYSIKVLPAERISHYGHFGARPMTAEEFESRPQVLLVGQYSTGKTSMVKWLTGCQSDHFDIRPQPSTDKFMAVVHGSEEHLIHGNAASCLRQLPYQGLSVFGGAFLDSFQALALPAERLKHISLIDTPGVLAGRKQSIGRSYCFSAVCAWMAERADLVLLTFDAHKLDISDEFQEAMEVLRPYADKVRCVLNKADQIDASNLVRVYGALLWNVGKVLQTPEVARVFVSSFWDQPYRFREHRQLFDEDKEAILNELDRLPRTTLLRKTHSVVARVRRVRAHYCITTYLRSQLPWYLWGYNPEARTRSWLDKHLHRLFDEARRQHSISEGDMPDIEGFRRKLASLDQILNLPSWQPGIISTLDRVINIDAPAVMDLVSGGPSRDHLNVSPAPPALRPSRLGALAALLGWGPGGHGGAVEGEPHWKKPRFD